MPDAVTMTRVAYSPGEFASLFGRSQTWGYRQIYAGKVNAITEHGRILIPAKEVERVLESAGIYNGLEKPRQQKARVAKLNAEQQGVWHRFLAMRKGQPAVEPNNDEPAPKGRSSPNWNTASRKAVIGRLTKASRKP